MQTQLEQLHGGTTERAAQRRSLLIALGRQWLRRAIPPGRRVQQGGGNFLERLFGAEQQPVFIAQLAVGRQFPHDLRAHLRRLLFPDLVLGARQQIPDDERTCQRMCPAAEVSLYTYHNPGEEVTQAVSVNGGTPYTALPNAFRYRTAVDPACSCRRPGQSWADALKATGADATVAPGDVVVTDQHAKKMSQPRDAAGRPIKPDPRAAAPARAGD